MKKLVVANWKMNPVRGVEARKLWKSVTTAASKLKNVETVVCPPLVYLETLGAMVTHRNCVIGAQDAFWEHDGAYTGQVSPDMIFNARGRYVIVGHSERRALGETDEMIAKKLKNILQFPLIPILCVGETKREGDGKYAQVLKQQIVRATESLTSEEVSRLVIAYEPVWAISSSKKARPCSPAECREAVHVIKKILADILGDGEKTKHVPMLYGGSVNIENAESFLFDGLVDGLLVGRASLNAKEFITILKKAEQVGARETSM